MVFNGINLLGLEDLYDLFVINVDVNVKNGVKLIYGKGVGFRNEIFFVILVKSFEC